MQVQDLTQELMRFGQDVSGTKEQLLDRLFDVVIATASSEGAAAEHPAPSTASTIHDTVGSTPITRSKAVQGQLLNGSAVAAHEALPHSSGSTISNTTQEKVGHAIARMLPQHNNQEPQTRAPAAFVRPSASAGSSTNGSTTSNSNRTVARAKNTSTPSLASALPAGVAVSNLVAANAITSVEQALAVCSAVGLHPAALPSFPSQKRQHTYDIADLSLSKDVQDLVLVVSGNGV